MTIIIYTFVSVAIVSLVALISIVALSLKTKLLKKILIFFVSFSAGGLLGGAFFHLLPEAAQSGLTFKIALYTVIGILFSFAVEKIINWRHCHNPEHIDKCVHSYAFMNLFGDGVHNFIDGLIIGAAYLVDIELGLITTLAVVLHEIPQEIGDFGVLLHGGFSKKKAVLFNFLTALTALIGAALSLIIGSQIQGITDFLVPFAAGGFIYIAVADLMPELHKTKKFIQSAGQLLFIILGMAVIGAMIFLPFEHSHETETLDKTIGHHDVEHVH